MGKSCKDFAGMLGLGGGPPRPGWSTTQAGGRRWLRSGQLSLPGAVGNDAVSLLLTARDENGSGYPLDRRAYEARAIARSRGTNFGGSDPVGKTDSRRFFGYRVCVAPGDRKDVWQFLTHLRRSDRLRHGG